MPHHFKALHTLSKLMFLGAVIYLLGGFGFFFVALAGHSKHCHSRGRGQSVCMAGVCVFGGVMGLGSQGLQEQGGCHHRFGYLKFHPLVCFFGMVEYFDDDFFGAAPLGTAWARTATSRRFT